MAPGVASQRFIAEKGALWLRATARGEYRHGAFTEGMGGDRGNAILRLARFLDRAHDVDLCAPPHPRLKPPTINVGLIEGGLSTPLVPPSASAMIDVRLVPGLEADDVVATFRSVAGPHVDIEVVDVKPPVDTAPDEPFVAAAKAACKDVLGRADRPGGVAYYSDATIIAPALGLPTVIIGPGEIGMSGAVDEYVETDKLVASTAIFARVAERQLA